MRVVAPDGSEHFRKDPRCKYAVVGMINGYPFVSWRYSRAAAVRALARYEQLPREAGHKITQAEVVEATCD